MKRDLNPNRVLAQICKQYDGPDTLAQWAINPGADRKQTYQRLLSHAASVGLDVSICPEDSKLIVTVNIRI